MKKISFFIMMLLLNCSLLFSQVGVNNDGSSPDPTSMLDVKSTSRGLLVPRMTMTDLESILNPATGLLVYCIDDNNFFVNRGGPSSPDWMIVNSKWRANGLHIYYTGQNVGIGTETPAALLHTLGTGTGRGNVVFAGEYKTDFPGDPPVSGAGTRMMWYPDKAALRVGDVSDDQWDAANIGGCSIAMGYNVTASGIASTALGSYATASNTVSVAIGHGTISSGIYATTMGESTTASGYASTAMNNHTNAAAYVSTAFGQYNVGGGTANSWVSTDPLFEIGNGASWTSLSNALTVLKNGNTGIGTETPAALLHTIGTGTGKGNVVFAGEYKTDFPGNPPVSGAGTRMMWYPDKAALRVGDVSDDQWDAANIGGCSIAMGYNVTASGVASTAMGSYATASNTVSVAIGHGAISYGIYATAMGESTTASGYASTAMNNHTNAAAYVSTALGQYNVGGGTANSWVGTDPLFEIGNGASWTSLSNALTVLKNGNTGIGTINPDAKLEVAGQVKIMGGNPGPGKVLTSDAGGLASWQTPSGLTLPYEGSISANQAAFKITNTHSSFPSSAIGIYGASTGLHHGIGVYGLDGSQLGIGIGVYGISESDSGYAVSGWAKSAYGPTNGVRGVSDSQGGYGVFGMASSTTGTNIGVLGYTKSNDGYSGYFVGGRFSILGNTGIGTITPAYKLDVAGAANLNSGVTSGVALRCNGAEALWANATYFSWGYGATYNYFASPVTIGTADVPGYTLVVNGTAAKTDGGSWSTLSDARLKNLLGNYNRGLEDIVRLQPVRFTYKEGNPRELDSQKEQIGFIAQEVLKVFPEAISEAKDGYLDFNMHPVNVAIVNAIKELKAENDRLKAENQRMNARLEKIEALMSLLTEN